MYAIAGLCPVEEMSGYGFEISLHPDFRTAVARSQLTQEKVTNRLERRVEGWLLRCGYETTPLYDARDVRVQWGEWGPEHILVPGNACGLNIDEKTTSVFHDGRVLSPHNVDCWRQVQLLLVVFTDLAYTVLLQARSHRADGIDLNKPATHPKSPPPPPKGA